MSKIFKKSNIMPVIVLTVICIVIAAVLGVTNMLTEDRIEFNENQKKYESLRVVIDGAFEPIDKPAGAPESVQDVYKATDSSGKLVGYAVTLKVQGYASEISLTVGVSTDGSVTKAVVTSQAESHGKPGMANYTDNFTGVAKDEVANVDTFSGATVSSTAIKNAIIDAVNTVTGNVSEEEPEIPLPRDESEIIAAAKTLVGKDDALLTNVTPEDMEYALRIYKAGNEGYVAYTVVMSRYGYPETETLIHVGNNGTIKSVNKLVWKTSDAVEGLYQPPTPDVVDAFYAKLAGKKASDLKAFENTDLVSNATNTSTNLRDALVEALEAIEGLILKDMPTPEEQLIPMINELVGAETELTDVTPDGMKYARRIYKAGNLGYVAYTVVISSNYGTVETETLTYVGNNGVINNVKKIIWKTSDMVETPYYSYYPPSDETVNAFYAKLIGKKASDLKAFEATDLVSNATNTSTNLRDALAEALDAIEILIRNDMPTAEADVKALAGTLIGKEVELVDVTPRNMQYVRRIWSAGEDGYVVYAVVISSNYGTVETETLVHVGNDGVIKNVKKMIWKTSDMVETPYYSYYPPTEETVKEFYAKLIGKKSSDLKAFEAADLVSNATNTSTSLRDAIAEGLEAVETIEASKCCDKDSVNYTARILGISLLVVAILGFVAYKIVPEIKKRRKNG